MTDNPYATPPSSGAPLPTPPLTVGYRSAATLVTILTFFMLCEMGLNVLLGGMSVLELTMFIEEVEVTDELVAADFFYMGYACVGLTQLVIVITCVVLFCIWIYRANHNARALGAAGMKFTPGWSVGWFFIPIANLFMPFRAVSEIYRASSHTEGSTSWMATKAPAFLGWWWGLWIITNLVENFEGRLAFSDNLEALKISAVLGMVAGILAIPLTLLAIQVVRKLHRLQEAKYELVGDSPAAATASSPVVMPPIAVDPLVAKTPGQSEPLTCPWCDAVLQPNAKSTCPDCHRPI